MWVQGDGAWKRKKVVRVAAAVGGTYVLCSSGTGRDK